MYYLLAILLVILVTYVALRNKPPVYTLNKLEKTAKGWRGEVAITYNGKKYLQTWVTDHGTYWHNTETLQMTSPSNWGGSGDAVADLLQDAMYQHEVKEKVAGLT